MGTLADDLRAHTLVGIDASAFIYQFERHPQFSLVTMPFFELIEAGAFRGATSTLTLLEVTVQPLKSGRLDLVDQYEALITTNPHLDVVDLARSVIQRAALLRAVHGVRVADALQIAACLSVGATAFFTNDRRLRNFPDLRVIVLGDYAGRP